MAKILQFPSPGRGGTTMTAIWKKGRFGLWFESPIATIVTVERMARLSGRPATDYLKALAERLEGDSRVGRYP
jgi:hypothetical protein